MSIISKDVQVRNNSKNSKYYKDKGYNIGKQGDLFFVKCEDLMPNCAIKILVQCDYCGEIYESSLHRLKRCNFNTICCNKCKSKKASDTSFEKYGVKNPMQSFIFQEKLKQSMIKKYGVATPMESEELKDNFKKSMIKKYGVDNSMKLESVKRKVRESLYKNGTAPSSKAQRHICDLLNGDLNTSCSYYNIDITIGNIAIEYNGSGHKLHVIHKTITEKQYNKKEGLRHIALLNNNYKIIYLDNYTDKLPKDKMLLNIIENAKFFLENFDDKWIRINLDNSEISVKEDKK